MPVPHRLTMAEPGLKHHLYDDKSQHVVFHLTHRGMHAPARLWGGFGAPELKVLLRGGLAARKEGRAGCRGGYDV